MKRRYIVMLLIILLMTLILGGCQKGVIKAAGKLEEEMGMDDPHIIVETFYNGFVTGDHQPFAEIFDGNVDDAELIQGMKNWSTWFKGDLIDYQLVGFHINKNITNGQSTLTMQYTYQINTSYDAYYMQFIMMGENRDSLVMQGIHVTTVDDAENQSVKTVGRSPWQIGVLVYGILCWGLIIFTLIRCVLLRPKLWILWLIGILFQSGLSFHLYQDGFEFEFHFIKTATSQLQMDGVGQMVLTILVPVVALIYLLLEKRWRKQMKLKEIIQQRKVKKRAKIAARQQAEEEAQAFGMGLGAARESFVADSQKVSQTEPSDDGVVDDKAVAVDEDMSEDAVDDIDDMDKETMDEQA